MPRVDSKSIETIPALESNRDSINKVNRAQVFTIKKKKLTTDVS